MTKTCAFVSAMLPADYIPLTPSITVPAGTTTEERVCVPVFIGDDTVSERTESFLVFLHVGSGLSAGSGLNPQVDSSRSLHTVFIEDDDGNIHEITN